MRSAQAAQVFHFHELGPAHIIGGGVRGRAPAAIFSRISLRSAVSSTLVLHRSGDRLVPVEHGRYVAQHIRDAKYVDLSGRDHTFWTGDADALLNEVQEFLTGVRSGPEPDRVLATVLFTDIVGSSERAAELGDHR